MTKYLNKSAYRINNNMLFKHLLVGILVLFSTISLASAADLEYVYKLNSDNSINRPCFNQGTNGWCSAGATCEVTVLDENLDVLIPGGQMTNQISFHNYSLPPISKQGIYKVDMACSDNNQTGYDTFYFGVNEAGSDYSKATGMFILLGVLVILMILFGVFSYYLSDSLRLAFLLLTFLMLPVTLWVALNIVKNAFMGDMFINLLTWSFGVSLVGFFTMVLYVCFTLFMALKIQKSPGQPELGSGYGHPLYGRSTRNSREED
jgi:hypothetical protein